MINAWATRASAADTPQFAISVEELLAAYAPECGIPGPAHSRCMRAGGHPPPFCAALTTDTEGVPIVVCWWPAGCFPTPDRASRGEPGA